MNVLTTQAGGRASKTIHESLKIPRCPEDCQGLQCTHPIERLVSLGALLTGYWDGTQVCLRTYRV